MGPFPLEKNRLEVLRSARARSYHGGTPPDCCLLHLLLKCFCMSCGYLQYNMSPMTLISHLPSAGLRWVAGLIISPVVSMLELALRCSYQGKLQGLATPGQRGALPHTSGSDNNGLFYFFLTSPGHSLVPPVMGRNASASHLLRSNAQHPS